MEGNINRKSTNRKQNKDNRPPGHQLHVALVEEVEQVLGVNRLCVAEQAYSLSFTEVLKGNLSELRRRTEVPHGLLDSCVGMHRGNRN
jgi:hypothetical protein